MKYIHTLVKYAAVSILTAGLLMACHPAENKETKPQTAQVTEADKHHGEETSAKISLNNGAKWKADSSTNKNVSALRNVIKYATPASLEDYHNTGNALQEGISKMVSECRMQGPDHDALHQWLEPLMEMNKKLIVVRSTTEGGETFDNIKNQISLYAQFFE